MAFVIKKKVSLEFLGEEYKDAYLTFKSIPVIELEAIQENAKRFEKDQKGSVTYILDLLKKHFIYGKAPEEEQLVDVKSEDLNNLDVESMLKCFQVLVGQELDPKAVTPSTNTLPTAEAHQ